MDTTEDAGAQPMQELPENLARAYEFLRQQSASSRTTSGGDMARFMYPDSPAWSKRTRGRRTGTQSGQLGGTMPMLGAKLLWELERRGLARQLVDRQWETNE